MKALKAEEFLQLDPVRGCHGIQRQERSKAWLVADFEGEGHEPENADRLWRLRETLVTDSKEMGTSVLSLHGTELLNNLKEQAWKYIFFQNLQVRIPAGWHFDFGRRGPGAEKSAGLIGLLTYKKQWGDEFVLF